MKNKYTVIIPIHELPKNMESYYQRAVESVEKQTYRNIEIAIVGPADVIKRVVEIIEATETPSDSLNIYCIEHKSKNYNIQSQVNYAVNKISTDYFSVLEFDDTFNNFWFEKADLYVEDSVNTIYCPINCVYSEEGKMLGFSNEEPWAASFTEEIGFIDIESLMYQNRYRLHGAIIPTKLFNEVGGLKESMKAAFWQEFTLRTIKNNNKIQITSYFGYNHVIDRKGGFDDTISTTLDEKELMFWFNLPNEEYLFKKDRKIKFEK